MANFVPKLWVNPFEKMSVFRLFRLFFCRLQRRLFDVECGKRHFLGPYCQKKKSWKKGKFWTKTMGYPLWKNVNISTFWTSCFYGLERRFFVLEYRKRNFPGLYGLKKKVGKMANFGPKLWVNPFGKMSVFRLSELFVLIGYKGVFSM